MSKRPIRKLEITPDVERMTVRAPVPVPTVERRPDVRANARPLSEIEITPRFLTACLYVDKFDKLHWNEERAHDTMRALGFKEQDIADARALCAYRKNR